MSTTTTTTTMRSSQRVLLEAFPAPPSHIPSPANPPPTGPPSLPLPPVPGPSRVSVDEQLLFLSSVANRSQRSSKYSVASSHRDSVVSIGSSRRTSVVSSSPVASPRTPTFFTRPSISVSSAPSSRLLPGDHLTRLCVSPLLLSDIEDDESDVVIPSRMPSPFLDSSWRRSKHQQNESISSIDVRTILAIDPDATDEPLDELTIVSRPPLPHSALPVSPKSVARLQMLTHPTSLNSSSSSNSPSSPISSSPTSISDAGSEIPNSSLTVKDLRLERRAERTKSPGLKRVLAVRSRSRSTGPVGNRSPMPKPAELPPITLNDSKPTSPVLITNTSSTTHQLDQPRKDDDMTLEELGPLPTQELNLAATRSRSSTMSSTIVFPTQKVVNKSPQSDPPRTPSPDIESILSTTPRPTLRKVASQSRIRSQGIIRRRLDSASNPDYRRRASEGVIREMRSTPSWHGHDLSDMQRSRTLSRSSHGMSAEGDGDPERMGSDDESRAKKDGDDSDSSLDLHTPLPHLMVKDGLLSPNSRLLPFSTRRRDGRSDSIMTCASTLTKTGIMKDERDTPMRRVRHRDNRLLKGGIGLTTGLGWSDSEDEDAPSPLTRRLSTLNLSRRSSASSIRTTGSVVSHRHPLSRSYSSGALIAPELERLEDVDEETTVPPSVRPRLPSAGRLSRPMIPPTSWLNKSTAQNRNSGTRTSTSSVGSAFSVETTLSDGIPRRPSKLGRPGSGLRDSSGSSENYSRKGSPGNDRTSSSTASTLSTGMPPTPRDYDPAMSSPAGFGTRLYNIEKSLPPLPNGVKKRPSKSRLENLSNSTYSFPRPRTFSSTSSVPSPTSPGSPVRPLQLPRQTGRMTGTGGGGDRAAVPVPSVVSSSASASQSTIRPSVPRSPPLEKVDLSAGGTVRPRPRTGTGMVYRTSSGSRIRAPMTLSSSTSVLERNDATVVGTIGRANGSRIPPV